MVSMSVILPTARGDYPIIKLPNVHVLKPTIESLKSQTFKDFEFIVVDALYHLRPKLFQGEPFYSDVLPFPIKHIPIHQNHRFWMDNKRWNLAGTLNTGIIHSIGELLVIINDCSEFDSGYLQKFWNGYQNGYISLAMSIRYEADSRFSSDIENQGRDDVLRKIYGKNGLIRDPRYEHVKNSGGRSVISYFDWYYGYNSVPIDAALKINGYDELFDGDESLVDVDFGSRLEMVGYNKFLLNIDHQVVEHNNYTISEDLVNKDTKHIKCNYAIFLLNRVKNRWRANFDKLTDKDIQFIGSDSFNLSPCKIPNYYDDDGRGRLFELWLSHQPIFDLKEERKKIET